MNTGSLESLFFSTAQPLGCCVCKHDRLNPLFYRELQDTKNAAGECPGYEERRTRPILFNFQFSGNVWSSS